MRSNPKVTSPTRPEPMPFMTIRATAAALGISSYHLRRLLRESKLPGFYSGNRFLVDIADLQAAIREGTL